MGFAAQATFWSAVDFHEAVMTTICGALGRPLQGALLEEVTALDAMADLLMAGVAVDAKVMVEHEASLVYEASPWAADKRAAEIVRPAPVQSADWVPPKSLARDMAFAKLQSRILSAAEAVQAAKLHADVLPEQQAIMLSAWDQALARIGRPCTNHLQNWHRMRNGGWQWRCDSARHQMQASAPRVLCGKEMMETCVSNRWLSTLSTLSAANTGVPGRDRTVRSNAPCAG